MMLHGQFAVGFFDFGIISVAPNAQRFVKIFF
jgi:hypothetical protein